MQFNALNLAPTVINYINEIKASYEQCIDEIKASYEQHIYEIKASYEQHIKESDNKYLILKEQYDLLLYKRFMRSAEELKADTKQPLLFTEEAIEAEDAKEKDEFTEVKSHKRNKKGRKAIAADIERKERVIDIPEAEKTCACGEKLSRIGEETSEKLVIIPAEVYVDKIIRPKYICRTCEGIEDEDKPTIRIAPIEPSLIPRSIVSPSLLSTIMVQKYEYHLPFYRQEKLFNQIGVKISRQDMCNWQQKAYKALAPLFLLLEKTLRSGPVIRMDETTVQVVNEKDRDYSQKSYMWLALGGPEGKTVVLYEYRQSRSSEYAKIILKGYCGYLQTDGYSVYDSVVKLFPGIIHVGCFAHARRKFFEAAKIAEQGDTAKRGIEFIRLLYQIESELRNEKEEKKKTDDEFLIERKTRAGPVLTDLKTWLLNNVASVPPGCLLGKAIKYSLSQWDKLIRYLESPYLTPDNNACENAIRPFVLGRKNWLFNQSADGAKSSCGMYSLIETAKQNGLGVCCTLGHVFVFRVIFHGIF